MPSPTEITEPTSATFMTVSKFSICWRMILLISSALICAMFTPYRESVVSLAHQVGAEAIELPANRSIIDGAADPGHHSPNQGRIERKIHPHLLARFIFQRRHQSLPFF